MATTKSRASVRTRVLWGEAREWQVEVGPIRAASLAKLGQAPEVWTVTRRATRNTGAAVLPNLSLSAMSDIVGRGGYVDGRMLRSLCRAVAKGRFGL